MSDRSRNCAKQAPQRWSIGSLLIWAVNLPLLLVLAVLLPLDYRREMSNAIAAKRVSLEKEARTVYHSVAGFGPDTSHEVVQRYINSFCVGMEEPQPDHRIAIRWHDRLLQTDSRCGTPLSTHGVTQETNTSHGDVPSTDNQELVVGTFSANGIDVYVSEYVNNLRHSIRHEILLHLVWLAGLAVAAALIVNSLLWWLVTWPVTRLSHTVSHIARGEYAQSCETFRNREMDTLSSAIQRMSTSLAENERDRHMQMERARRIQDRLLPNGVEVPGLHIAHVYEPADEVAGDYYDLIRLPDSTWLICMADVSGHGIAAAMGAVMLKALVLHAVENCCAPRDVLRFVNQRLPALLADEFITMCVARWNPRTRTLQYASAGHEPSLLVSVAKGTRSLPATGLPLGIDLDTDWEIEVFSLAPGEQLLLITDGVAEASDSQGHLFGREHLNDMLVRVQSRSPVEVVSAIRNCVLEHRAGERATDDVSILLLEVRDHEEVDVASSACERVPLNWHRRMEAPRSAIRRRAC